MPRILLSCLLPALLFISCSQPDREPADTGVAKIRVVSITYPLHFFAARTGGSFVEQTFPLPPDAEPADWHPDANEIAVFQRADLILTNGPNYAKRLDRVSLPAARMVNTSKAFSDRYLELEVGMTHMHGPEGEHEHLGFAFTTWPDFRNASVQAEAVKTELVERVPDAEWAFEENFAQLSAELAALDQKAAHASSPLAGTTLYASHPVYQYFAQGYNLSIASEH